MDISDHESLAELLEKLTVGGAIEKTSTNTDDNHLKNIVKITTQKSVIDVLKFIKQRLESKFPKVKTILNFHYLLKNCPKDWLSPCADSNSNICVVTEVIIDEMCRFVLNSLNVKEEKPLDETDFEGCADSATCVCECLHTLVIQLYNCNKDLLVKLISSKLFLIIEVIAVNGNTGLLWTNSSSVSAAQLLLKTLQEHSGYKNIEDMLTSSSTLAGNSIVGKSVFVQILDDIQINLLREEWKKHPGAAQIFMWCLFHVRLPHLSDHIDRVLPPSLLLCDDYLLENKLVGVRCLNHIINNISSAELSWFGRQDVVYDVLKRHLYTHEADMISCLHPCLLGLIKAMYRTGLKSCEDSWGEYDDVMQIVLFDMEMENKIVLRRAYSAQLSSFVEIMGLGVVRHFRRLLRVIKGYLETYDGPEETSRLNILTVLKAVLTVTWPRIPAHAADIVKALLRLVCDVSMDSTSLTPDSVKSELLRKATECLTLLKQICGDPVIILLQTVKETSVPGCSKVIDEVLST